MKRFMFSPITENQVIIILLSPLYQNSAIKKPQSKTDSLCFDCWKTESESNFALLIKLKTADDTFFHRKRRQHIFPTICEWKEKETLMNFQGRACQEKKRHIALIGHWAILTQSRLDCGIQIYPIYWPLGCKNSLHTQHRASLPLLSYDNLQVLAMEKTIFSPHIEQNKPPLSRRRSQLILYHQHLRSHHQIPCPVTAAGLPNPQSTADHRLLHQQMICPLDLTNNYLCEELESMKKSNPSC